MGFFVFDFCHQMLWCHPIFQLKCLLNKFPFSLFYKTVRLILEILGKLVGCWEYNDILHKWCVWQHHSNSFCSVFCDWFTHIFSNLWTYKFETRNWCGWRFGFRWCWCWWNDRQFKMWQKMSKTWGVCFYFKTHEWKFDFKGLNGNNKSYFWVLNLIRLFPNRKKGTLIWINDKFLFGNFPSFFRF